MTFFRKALLLACLIFFSGGWFYAGELPAGWKIAFQSKYSDDKKMYVAGFLNDKFGVMAGYAGAVFYTSDGGKTWYGGKNTSWCRWGMDILDEKTAYTCGNSGHNRISKDGGVTWTLLSDYGGMEPDNGKFISFADRDNGWAAARLKLASTRDGGLTWNEIALPPDSKMLYAVTLRKKDEGYILDRTGQLFETKDGGKSWNKMHFELNGRTIIPFPFNNAVASVGFWDEKNGKVILFMVKPERQWVSYITSDGGKSWKEESLPINTFGAVYLSHDGKTLSITDTIDKMITVLHPL